MTNLSAAGARHPSAEIVEGRRPVLEALRSGLGVERVVLLHGLRGSIIDRIRKEARAGGVPLSEAPAGRFRELGGGEHSQGAIAVLQATKFVEVEELLEVARRKNQPSFLLVLDEIEDPHNLGALMRTAECSGVHGVIIPKHRSAPVNRTVAKTSAGASLHLPVARVTNLAQTLDELTHLGVWVVGLDPGGGRSYDEVEYDGAVAVVVGNEGRGIRRLVKEKCDVLVKIPVLGSVQSLNASVAGGLVMYEVRRKRTLRGRLIAENSATT